MFENSDRSIDAMESRLLELETMVSRIRSEQVTILAELDAAQVAALDGSRSLVEWTAARMDVTSETAGALVYGSRVAAEHGELAKALGDGPPAVRRFVLWRPMRAVWRMVAAADIGSSRIMCENAAAAATTTRRT